MPNISVIIPIYNVVSYLRQCLESIHLFGDERVEILLVNDGSTDDSPTICDEYQSKYDNVRVINKQNGGLSDARNVGTNEANGRWIYYLDSDDWLVPGAIIKLYEYAENNNCDIVQGGFYYAYSDHYLLDERFVKRDKMPFTLNREEAMRELIKNNYVKNFAWGKLYRADIVKRHLFPVGKFYEDSYWQHLIIHECNIYGVIPEPLYYYRQRNESISGGFSKRNLDLLKGNEERLKFIMKIYPSFQSLCADKLWYLSSQCVDISKRHKHSGLFKKYQIYLDYVNHEYGSLFSKELKESLTYTLLCNDSFLYPIYIFYRRLKNHFKYNGLTKIQWKDAQ